MGEALGTQFHLLWQEVAWLYKKGGEYVELYGSKPTRVELLNKTAPEFFGIIQGVLWEEVLLHIARLTDEPKSGRNKNLTIQNLPDLVDALLKCVLQQMVDKALNLRRFCRDWRNRHIAHRDLDLAINKEASPLEPASRKQVNEALRAIVNVLNAVDVHYTESESHFLNPTKQGAVQLLHVLDAGIKKQREWDERRRKGEWAIEDSPEDL
jgi:AbiU2